MSTARTWATKEIKREVEAQMKKTWRIIKPARIDGSAQNVRLHQAQIKKEIDITVIRDIPDAC
jgi:hypothetical protein